MKLSFLPIIRKGKKRNRAKKLSKFMSCSLSKKKLKNPQILASKYCHRMANNQMKHPALNENPECAKKVVCDSLGLVDFAIWLVNSVLNLPKEQVKFFKKFKLQKNCNQCCLFKIFWASTY